MGKGEFVLQETITFYFNKKKYVISVSKILYIITAGINTEIHVSGGKVYNTKTTLSKYEEVLGDIFIKAYRGCIISVMAIHDITDRIYLSNGEALPYPPRKKKKIIEEFRLKQQNIINSFNNDDIPKTKEEYGEHYNGFDNMPFAFADIEMVFNEEHHAVDWIFRYGNPALASLEKMPPERLIGSSFDSLFANMDSKWLRGFERAALYGEMLEIIDYSPDIEAYLKVICFPTFKGHCGCILFNISEIEFIKNSSNTEKALSLYFRNTSPNKTESKE